MKNILKLSLVTCMAISFLNAQDVKSEGSLSEGKVTGEIRSKYLGVSSDAQDNHATAIGAMIKYESASLYDMSAGFGFNTSEDIGSLSGDRSKNERNPELSSSNGEYTVLSEAYLNYSNSNLNVRLGRQVVDTPLADSDDIGMIANTFEAYMATYELSNITLTAGNLQKWQGVDTGLDDGWLDTGDTGTWLGGITYSSDVEASAWFYSVGGLTNAIYADVSYTQKINDDTSLNIAGQFINEAEVDNSGVEANIIGASLGLEVQGLGLSLAYNQSSKADAKASFSGFGGGTLFTNMDIMIIDEITEDRDAQAFVIGASYAISHLNLSYAYGNFTGDANSLSAKEHIVEQDIILEYELNENLALEVIYVMSSDEESSVDTGFDFNSAEVKLSYVF